MLRFLLGIAVGWAAASTLQGKQRSPDSSRATGGRVDELSTAQDDPSFGIGELNVGDGTPSAPTGRSTRDGDKGERPANLAPTRAAGGSTSDTFNGA